MQALHAGRVEAAFRMAVEGEGEDVGVGDTSEDARHLTVEDRADLWEWFEEFVEDMTMDIAKASCLFGLVGLLSPGGRIKGLSGYLYFWADRSLI